VSGTFHGGSGVRFGRQPVSFQIGARYYADSLAAGPDWDARFNVILLFPRLRLEMMRA
jgi:hypothetical protein